MTGVIYARYSSENQREESIEGQLRECRAFAEKNDITILSTYIDRAMSAKTDNRPDFQRMIKDSGKDMFDIVIVWKLDRFARNRYDSAHYKSILKKNGVKVLSATEVISGGAEGILLESLLEGYAEYYSAELAEKVVRGMTDNALKCRFNGGTLPIGYKVDSEHRFQIDPLTAPAVLEAFEHYASGDTMQQVVDELNAKGVHTKMNGKASVNSVTRMLHNRRYIGEYQYRDIVIPDGIPAIVPKELFDRVQMRMAHTKKAPAQHKAEDDYILTTKLRCGKCQSFMVGESGTSKTQKNVHHYYKCVGVKYHRGCDKKTVRKEWIERIVLQKIKEVIMDDDLIDRLADELVMLLGQESTALPLLKSQMSEVEKGITNMLNAIQAGIFTPSTKQRLDELEQQKSDLSVRIMQEEMAKPQISKEVFVVWLRHFRKFDMNKKEHRAKLIDSFVNVIYLYDDHLDIFLNYKDGATTVVFDYVMLAQAKERKKSIPSSSDLSSLGVP